jgi:hypothetical protein
VTYLARSWYTRERKASPDTIRPMPAPAHSAVASTHSAGAVLQRLPLPKWSIVSPCLRGCTHCDPIAALPRCWLEGRTARLRQCRCALVRRQPLRHALVIRVCAAQLCVTCCAAREGWRTLPTYIMT